MKDVALKEERVNHCRRRSGGRKAETWGRAGAGSSSLAVVAVPDVPEETCRADRRSRRR